VFSLSSFKGKIGNKKSFGGTGEMLWGAGRSPWIFLFFGLFLTLRFFVPSHVG